MRKIQFVNNKWYHIYNRGVDKRLILKDKNDYQKFLADLRDFNNQSLYEERLKIITSNGFKELSSFLAGFPKMVDILVYSLNPNHYHIVLKQLIENGISNFMHKLGTSYTNFFNKKYQRSGSLFQGPFRAIHIDNDNYLLWLSGYVNGNIEIHGTTEAKTYKWSSLKNFLKLEKNEILGDIDIILSQFQGQKEYKNFIRMVIEESKKRKDLEKYEQ